MSLRIDRPYCPATKCKFNCSSGQCESYSQYDGCRKMKDYINEHNRIMEENKILWEFILELKKERGYC